MTSLGREGIQMFRYWSNDLVVKRAFSECACGRTWDWYEAGIQGRHDDMRKIRGVWFMPVMVEDVVRGFPDIDEFQSELMTIDALDTLVIQIEARPDVASSEHEDLAERFRAEFRRQVQINPVVKVVEPGTLPRFEMKARRFADRRSVPAGTIT